MHKQGEIVLIPVPFSDLTSVKKRPVLIISNDEFNGRGEDVIVAAITSNIRGFEHEVVFDNTDLANGELKVISCIRADKIYTLYKRHHREDIWRNQIRKTGNFKRQNV